MISTDNQMTIITIRANNNTGQQNVGRGDDARRPGDEQTEDESHDEYSI